MICCNFLFIFITVSPSFSNYLQKSSFSVEYKTISLLLLISNYQLQTHTQIYHMTRQLYTYNYLMSVSISRSPCSHNLNFINTCIAQLSCMIITIDIESFIFGIIIYLACCQNEHPSNFADSNIEPEIR